MRGVFQFEMEPAVKNILAVYVAAAAAMILGTGAAFAQTDEYRDPDGYYSRTDHSGYYDRDGRYRPMNGDENMDYRGDNGGPPAYYREGDYERSCRGGHNAAGTVFGAIGGGLIGGAASHGNAGAVVGGVLLGGLLGNVLSRDVDCDSQRYAFNVYADGFNGDIGRRYDWRHGDDYGFFTPTREYQTDGLRCRDFSETSYHLGHEYQHDGAACYERDGYWHLR
jgi:surface antigen